MRSIVVSVLCGGSRSEDFEEKLNKALKGLDNKNCMTHSVKYAIAHTGGPHGGSMVYSAVILYDEVPTRSVIVEKAGG